MTTYLKAGLAVLFIALIGLCYHLFTSLQAAKTEYKSLSDSYTQLTKDKAKSDEAVAQLTIDLNKNQERTTQVVTKLVQIPVSPDEKYVSDVLKGALQDD